MIPMTYTLALTPEGYDVIGPREPTIYPVMTVRIAKGTPAHICDDIIAISILEALKPKPLPKPPSNLVAMVRGKRSGCR